MGVYANCILYIVNKKKIHYPATNLITVCHLSVSEMVTAQTWSIIYIYIYVYLKFTAPNSFNLLTNVNFIQTLVALDDIGYPVYLLGLATPKY